VSRLFHADATQEMKTTITAMILLAVMWPPLPASAVQVAAAVPDERTIAQELKSAEDPTLLNRRAWLETEWNTFSDGSSDVEQLLGGLWSWRVSSIQEWAVRLKLPYEWHLAGHSDDDSDQNGRGDVNVRAGTVFRLGDSWRIGGGLDLRMPSGSEAFSANVWRLQEVGAVGWEATHYLTLSPSFEHNESVAEESGTPPEHFLEVFLPAIVGLPQRWAATVRFETKLDFENDNTWTHSAKLAIAKELEQIPASFSLSIKKTFDGGDQPIQVTLIAAWFFRSKAPVVATGTVVR
jgi:hypothetical protein